jgi:hypothetical protein
MPPLLLPALQQMPPPLLLLLLLLLLLVLVLVLVLLLLLLLLLSLCVLGSMLAPLRCWCAHVRVLICLIPLGYVLTTFQHLIYSKV